MEFEELITWSMEIVLNDYRYSIFEQLTSKFFGYASRMIQYHA